MCYVNSTKQVKMFGKVGDSIEDLKLALFSDADFAGCSETMRSTSGVFLKLAGPNTHFPFNGLSNKQTCVSHSTPEAEIVAAELAIRQEGIPAIELWTTILERDITLEFLEDNQAAIRVLETGKNPTLRYLGRTHLVDMAWLFETFGKEVYDLRYCTSEEQAADIFTKHFTDKTKWKEVTRLIGTMTREELWGGSHATPKAPMSKKPRTTNTPTNPDGHHTR